MTGSTASMELPGRRSDLLPTRMMGTLGGQTPGHRGWGNWQGPPPAGPAHYLGPLSVTPFTSGIHLVRI